MLRMAIRFACTACQRPIEIDDEWANRAVLCPYCRQTVTAPAASTIPADGVPPTASGYETPPPQAPFAAARPAGNLIAVSALVAVVLAVVLMILAGVVLAPHRPEFKEITEAMESGRSQDLVEAQQRFFERHGGVPPWLLHAVVLFMGACLAWLAALVCGLLALRRTARRGWAVLALGLAATVPVLMCCGGGC